MTPIRTAVIALALVIAAGCAPEPGNPTTSTTSTTTTSTTTTSITSTTAPPEVAITTSLPASPAASTAPSLVGIAPPSTTIVRIFASTDCSGATVTSGSLAAFTAAGIPVDVGLGTTTTFTALASGPSVLACSAPFEYVNTLTTPTGYESEPNGTFVEADPVSVDVDQPADIAGQLDGPVGPDNSDLFVFTVDSGRSIRVETFDWTGASCDLLDTEIHLYPPTGQTGGSDDDKRNRSVFAHRPDR